ncbi:septum site-determining protein MinC [Gammaproteobacteria bacterium 45_16_T64]|nr:septum site-determining protein MinC [Gammaproteobacteria bacterium 45_16_T64]
MNTSDTEIELEPCFKLKGSRVTITILELYEYEYATFNDQLAETVRSAPDFFQQTPVILSLERCKDTGFIDFIELGELCREYGLVPVAIRGGSEEQLLSANVAGLPHLPVGAAKPPEAPKKQPEPAPEAPPIQNTVITTPVRSGQQVYAKGGDLIIIAPVSPGAEVLADGNIHIYGPLRGRALAGVSGNKNARIFCYSLEAELLSIGGIFTVDEDLKTSNWKKNIQAYLDGDKLVISAFS